MPSNAQAGTILIQNQPLIAAVLGLESEPFSGDWRKVSQLDAFALDRKIHAAGWNFFFLAVELKVMFLGAIGAQSVQNAVQRLLGKVRGQDFNCLEVTGIVAHRFCGIPYVTVLAHARHIQQSCYLDGAEKRRTRQLAPTSGERLNSFPLPELTHES
jgi:hypothetical protein